jgi:hypothetical protein
MKRLIKIIRINVAVAVLVIPAWAETYSWELLKRRVIFDDFFSAI